MVLVTYVILIKHTKHDIAHSYNRHGLMDGRVRLVTHILLDLQFVGIIHTTLYHDIVDEVASFFSIILLYDKD